MKHHKKTRFHLFALLIAGLLVLPLDFIHASGFLFGANEKEVHVGQYFEVGVFLNTERESINAVEGSVNFQDTVQAVEVDNGDSLVNFWITSPTIDDAGDTIEFSGIMPGSYTGEKGYLFSIVFQATTSGTVKIETNNEKILLADGMGTSSVIKKAPIEISVTVEGSGEDFVRPYDDTPPESFSPIVSRDVNIYENKLFVAFSTQDKISGVDHYEVKESWWNKYTTAESPYLLKNQRLNMNVKVKAIDKSGNSQVEVVHVKGTIIPYVYAILALFVFVILRVRKKNEKTF